MAAEPVWQPNYVDLCDERSIRFGAQCVICSARYATPSESLDQLLVREAIPTGELQKEIENAKRYIFTEFGNAYSGMLVTCYRCQRPACPDCWDDDNQMCGECVAARGLTRSPHRGLPSSNPLSDGRLMRVEPGRYSDAQRPSWLDALIATQPLDEPMGTPPKQPAVKPRPANDPAKHTLLDAALRGTSSPGAVSPDLSFPNTSLPDRFSPGVSAPGLSAPSMFSPGISSQDLFSQDLFSPGLSAPGLSAPGQSSPSISSPGMFSPSISSPGMFSAGISAPGVATLGAMDHAAQDNYLAGVFVPEPPYGNIPAPSPFSSQAEMPLAPIAEQFSPFSAPAAPPQMADSAWAYAGAGATSPATEAASASPGSAAKVECPRCGTSNYDFVSSCTNCQFRLIQDCPHCQQLNPGHATQCEYCGKPLARAPDWSQANLPAARASSEQKRGRSKNIADAMHATRRQPEVQKDERGERQAQYGASVSAGRGTDKTQGAPQTPIGQFVVQNGALIHYMEAHPFVARLTLWGERLLTTIVVFFVTGLITSIVIAELSATANETLRGVLHVNIRQVLEQFIAQMQIVIERFKH